MKLYKSLDEMTGEDFLNWSNIIEVGPFYVVCNPGEVQEAKEKVERMLRGIL